MFRPSADAFRVAVLTDVFYRSMRDHDLSLRGLDKPIEGVSLILDMAGDAAPLSQALIGEILHIISYVALDTDASPDIVSKAVALMERLVSRISKALLPGEHVSLDSPAVQVVLARTAPDNAIDCEFLCRACLAAL
jgi:hypothetical protein